MVLYITLYIYPIETYLIISFFIFFISYVKSMHHVNLANLIDESPLGPGYPLAKTAKLGTTRQLRDAA
jgi:hypothetical protein